MSFIHEIHQRHGLFQVVTLSQSTLNTGGSERQKAISDSL